MEKKPDEIFDIIKELFKDARCELDYNNNFELLIALILSAQATDISVNKVTKLLFEKYQNPKALKNASHDDVYKIIRAIGLGSSKTKNIIKTAKIIDEDFKCALPNDFNKIMSLPGVGRKCANVFLSLAYDVPSIAVDTHVKRVANRLGLSTSSDPFIIEEDLKKIYPISLWNKVHIHFLFFGRYLCHSKNPKCCLCPLKCDKLR